MKGIILGIVGGAGVGKDTAADYLISGHGFAKVSLADEMKRFSRVVFGFSEEQLWGPSERRNGRDLRYNNDDAWTEACWNLALHAPAWCRKLFPRPQHAAAALFEWFFDLRRKYGPLSGLSPRIVLQTIGTEFGRATDIGVWVRDTMSNAQAILDGHEYTRADGLGEWKGHVSTPVGVVIPDTRFRSEIDAVHAAGGFALRLYRPLKADPLTVGVQNHQSEAEMLALPDSVLDYVLHVEDGLYAYYAQLDALIERIRKEH